MLSVAGADHIITMDLHASQIQVSQPMKNISEHIYMYVCFLATTFVYLSLIFERFLIAPRFVYQSINYDKENVIFLLNDVTIFVY